MAPRIPRRRFVGALALAGGTALSGCVVDFQDDDSNGTADQTDTPAPETDATPGTDDPAHEDGTAAERSDTAAAVVRRFFEARATATDPGTVGQYVHPVHPLHDGTPDGERVDSLLVDASRVDQIDTETVDRQLEPSVVLTGPLFQAAAVDRATVAEALDGEQMTVVETTVTAVDGAATDYRVVTATYDGAWKVLALGFDRDVAAFPNEDYPLEARVVEDVTFDGEQDRARVHFLPSPVADAVTVRAANNRSSRSTSTPAVVEYFDVELDPSGDEVIVTATVDGEPRPIHRERYPPSEQVVEEITYDDGADSPAFGPVARLTFTGTQTDDRIAVTSTVKGARTALEPGADVTDAAVQIDPDGDEVVVTQTTDGETEELHRERYHPD